VRSDTKTHHLAEFSAGRDADESKVPNEVKFSIEINLRTRNPATRLI
jgi:hypothetical protein